MSGYAGRRKSAVGKLPPLDDAATAAETAQRAAGKMGQGGLGGSVGAVRPLDRGRRGSIVKPGAFFAEARNTRRHSCGMGIGMGMGTGAASLDPAAAASAAYLESCAQMQVLPEPILAKLTMATTARGDDAIDIDVHDYGIGNKVALALAAGIVSVELPVTSLNLRANRLSEQGVAAVLGSVDPRALTALNLAQNTIGRVGVRVLCELLRGDAHAGGGGGGGGGGGSGGGAGARAVTLPARMAGLPAPRQMLAKGALTIASLDLESCKLGDAGACQLCEALAADGVRVTLLNLGQNGIGARGAKALAAYISAETCALVTLQLSWNKLAASGGGDGVQALAAGVAVSPKLQTLDLSWNSVGKGSTSALAAMLETTTGLTHLDLSHNLISAEECTELAAALAQNHTLLGLHMTGNKTAVTSRGHLLPDAVSYNDGGESHVFTRILPGAGKKASVVDGGEKWSERGCCWICEDWRAHKFVWTPGESDRASLEAAFRVVDVDHSGAVDGRELPTLLKYLKVPASQAARLLEEADADGSGELELEEFVALMARLRAPRAVLLRTNFDNWEEEPMCLCEDGSFELVRMAPPGAVQYLFVVDGVQHASSAAHERAEPLNRRRRLPAVGLPTITLKAVNAVALDPRAADDDEIPLKPRVKRALAAEVAAHDAWTFPISIFFPYRQDTEQLVGDAFEADWAMMAAPKGVKSDVDAAACKALFRSHYTLIKALFKQYASLSSSLDVFSMGWNCFTDFTNNADIPDASVNRAALDMTFIGCNVGGPVDAKRNPKKLLCRFQFMDAIFKLATAKFKSQGGAPKVPPEQCRLMLEGHVAPLAIREELDQVEPWRARRLYNEECDELLKSHLPQLTKIFARFSGQENVPGEASTMCVSEYISLIENAQLVTSEFTGREAKLAYCRAMETEADELKTDEHRRMGFLEFLECIARVADTMDLAWLWQAEHGGDGGGGGGGGGAAAAAGAADGGGADADVAAAGLAPIDEDEDVAAANEGGEGEGEGEGGGEEAMGGEGGGGAAAAEALPAGEAEAALADSMDIALALGDVDADDVELQQGSTAPGQGALHARIRLMLTKVLKLAHPKFSKDAYKQNTARRLSRAS